MKRLAWWFAAALTSCQGPSRPSSPSGPELVLVGRLDLEGPPPIEGNLAQFEMEVRNASERFVILRDLTLADGTAVLSWQTAPPRPLRYDSVRDEFLQDPDGAPDADALNVGLLLPGETLRFRPQIRLLHFPRRYVLNYFAYTAEELAGNVYFEERTEDKRLRYRRWLAGEVAERLKLSAGSAAARRRIVFPHAYSVLEAPRRADLNLDVRVTPRAFRLEAALAHLGLGAADVREYTYGVALEAWAIRARSGAWLVSPRGKIPLPRITHFEFLFQYVDTLDAGVPVQFEFVGALDALFPNVRVVPVREKTRVRKLAFIPREDLPDFLRALHAEDLEIAVVTEGRSPSLRIRR
ncbi:MAG: hypothetical protein HY716_14165 [Planctomycetes bacterium]|nr:hypothetical protein [Planctomycetota bacterium]